MNLRGRERIASLVFQRTSSLSWPFDVGDARDVIGVALVRTTCSAVCERSSSFTKPFCVLPSENHRCQVSRPPLRSDR